MVKPSAVTIADEDDTGAVRPCRIPNHFQIAKDRIVSVVLDFDMLQRRLCAEQVRTEYDVVQRETML